MNKAQEILDRLKAFFNEEVTPVVVQPVQFTDYTLEDGVTVISISVLEAGGEVKIGDALAPAETYKLQDGSSIVVGEEGKITEVIPAATTTDTQVDNPLDMSAEFAEMKASFSTHVQAFSDYKAATDNHILGFSATIQKQDSVIKQLFELVTELTKSPAGDPPAAEKKAGLGFSKVELKSNKLNKFAEAAQKIKEQA